MFLLEYNDSWSKGDSRLISTTGKSKSRELNTRSRQGGVHHMELLPVRLEARSSRTDINVCSGCWCLDFRHCRLFRVDYDNETLSCHAFQEMEWNRIDLPGPACAYLGLMFLQSRRRTINLPENTKRLNQRFFQPVITLMSAVVFIVNAM